MVFYFHAIIMNLYEDGLFNRDLPTPVNSDVTWKRINTVVSKPKYFYKSLCICDLKQSGDLGNCYFISALYSTILYYQKSAPERIGIFLRQIKPLQQLYGPLYTGRIKIELNNGFALTEVHVDDYVPVHNKSNQLLFKYNNHNEFWATFLEKAILKFTHSSYKLADEGGLPASIFRFLFPTGSSCILKNPTPKTLQNYFKDPKNFIILASFENSPQIQNSIGIEQILETGIVTRHAMTAILAEGDPETLIILNPWGEVELGKSFQDNKINYLPLLTCPQCANSVKQKVENDGMWAMSLADAPKFFNRAYVFTALELPPSPSVTYSSKKGHAIIPKLERRSTSIFYIYVPNIVENRASIRDLSSFSISFSNGASFSIKPFINMLQIFRINSETPIGEISIMADTPKVSFVCGLLDQMG